MRQFTITDTKDGDWEHRCNLLKVLGTVPDINNSELESIVNLNVSESIDIDNITVIRTA